MPCQALTLAVPATGSGEFPTTRATAQILISNPTDADVTVDPPKGGGR